MPDELIDRLETKDYFRLIGELRPDATMIPDNYTYTDAPLYQSWSQTIRLVSFANDFLKLDVPLIGLVSFAMPARELFEEEMRDCFLPQILLILKTSYKKMSDFESL